MMRARRCEVCGHVFAEKHRLIPGSIGGIYSNWNIAYLCPNHHAALHFVMVAFPRTEKCDRRRLEGYLQDEQFMRFFEAIHLQLHEIRFYLKTNKHKSIFDADRDVAKHKAQDLLDALTQWRRSHAIY